jgi:hypothetical protein
VSAPRKERPEANVDAPEAIRPLSSLSERELEEELDRAGISVAADIVEGWRKPPVERIGLGYMAAFAQLGVELRFDRLRESRGETSCELTVLRYGSHLLRQRFNLVSGPTRASAAKDLDGRPRPKEWTRVDWREVLEMSCLAVLDLYRAGEPFSRVGHEPLSERSARRLIDPWLPFGKPTLLYAPWGAGKSTLGAALIVTLELGIQVVPGWPPPAEPVRCLVLDWESDRTEWNDRLARIAAGVGATWTADRAALYRACRGPLDEQVEQPAEMVTRHGIGFVLIDSAEKAIGASSGAESYGDRAGRLYEAIDRLGVTILVLDHVSGEDMKRTDGRVIRKAIGSTMKGAWARAVYELKREREPDTVEKRVELVLHTAKVNDAAPQRPFEFAIVYDDDAIRFERAKVTAPDLTEGLGKSERMRRLLADGSLTTKAIAERMNTSQGQVRSILSKDSGRRFKRMPDGLIVLLRP